MNVETLNSYLKEYFKVSKKVDDKIASKIISAPIFFVNFPDNFPIKLEDVCKSDEKNLLYCEGKISLPFSYVKVVDTFKNKNNEESFFVFLTHQEICLAILVIKSDRDNVVVIDASFKISDFLDQLNNGGIHDIPIQSLAYRLKPDLCFLSDPKNPTAPESVISLAKVLLERMLEFLLMVNCPRHFTTKVSPSNSAGRSVEWLARKSHYIILGPEHAKQVAGGHRGSFNGNITRAMHNRRAHFRRLTSEKFTKKRGLKIWVKSSWVGPTDWNDNQGNAYKIINPNR